MRAKIISIMLLMIGSCSLLPITISAQTESNLEIIITNHDTIICYNSQPPLLVSKIIGGTNDTLVYAWEKRGEIDLDWIRIENSNTDKYQPPPITIKTKYRVLMDTNLTLPIVDISNEVSIAVFDSLFADTITGASQQICYDDDAGTLYSDPHGGISNTFTWYKNSFNEIAGHDSTLQVGHLTANTIYWYSMTNICGTDTSAPYLIKVYSQLVANPITGGISPVCYEQSPGTLTAQYAGGSPLKTFKWYRNDTLLAETSSSLTVGPLKNTSVFEVSIQDNLCNDNVTSPGKTIKVFKPLKAGLIKGEYSHVCFGDDGGNLVADPSGGDSLSYDIKWYEKLYGTSLGSDDTLDLDTLQRTRQIYYVLSNGLCGSDTSDTYELVVFEPLTAGIITGNESICSGDIVGDLLSNVTGGSQEYNYSWYISGNLTPFSHEQDVYIDTLTQTTVFYYEAEDKFGCGTERSPDFTIEVISNETASVTIEPEPSIICEGNQVRYTAKPKPEIGSVTYSWSVNGGNEISSMNYLDAALTHNGEYVEVVVTYDASCIGNNPVTERLTPTINALPDNAQLIIKPENNDSIPPVVLIYPVNDSLKNYSYKWYLNGSILQGETGKFYYNPLENGGIIPESTYTIEITDEIGCSRKIEYTYSPQKSSLFAPSDIFTIYPNPNHGGFKLDLNKSMISETIEMIEMKVFDLNGRTILSKEIPCNNQNFDLSELDKGIYLIEVSAGLNSRQVKKLIIY